MKKRWVYLVFVPSDDGTTADIIYVFSSKKKCIEEVNYQHSHGHKEFDWYRSELL